MDTNMIVGVIGSGAMGSGIAQVAAVAGHRVVIADVHEGALEKAKANMAATLQKLQEKGKISNAGAIIERISFIPFHEQFLQHFSQCGLIIEAVIEDLKQKNIAFQMVESVVGADCILASNTSSLSIASIAAGCKKPSRVMGIHFFNPAPIMALVEIIPAIQTDSILIERVKDLITKWGKMPVIAKDTPGFIVNRIARPYYGEAIRLYEEGFTDIATIDWAMTAIGSFKMGPFTLMDFIGHDVNYVVTETVFKSFFYDPRYKPSFSQQRLYEARWLGRKSGRGFYSYAEDAPAPNPVQDRQLGTVIFERVLAMLINEAVEALYLGIASASDLEMAMTKGVNYPKGLLAWCDEWGAANCLAVLDRLYADYHEDRYRASVLLRKHAVGNQKFV